MRIDTNHIPHEGIELFEEFDPDKLDLATSNIEFRSPLEVHVRVSKITNALTVEVGVEARIQMICSRCLASFQEKIKKQMIFNYRVEASRPVIELDPDIREEIIIDYPINPLCKGTCKGLCARCGKNLNEGGCSCGTA